MRVRVLGCGAIPHGVEAPGRDGQVADVTLGHAAITGDLAAPDCSGASGGRSTLDGKSHRLTANDRTNALHGGRRGFDRRRWTAVAATARIPPTCTGAGGEDGYPGAPTTVDLTSRSVRNLAGEAARQSILPARPAFGPARPDPGGTRRDAIVHRFPTSAR